MKTARYFPLLLSMTALIMAVQPAMAETKQFTLVFDENDFTYSTNGHGELVINADNPMAIMPDGGFPAMPEFSAVIAVGEHQAYKGHKISVNKRRIRSGIIVEPAQYPVPTDSIFAGARIERVMPDYTLEQYPAENCAYATTSQWAGGVSTLHFLTCPFIYNPADGDLYFIDSMTLTVELDENPAPARAAAAYRHETPSFVRDMIINPDDIPAGPQRAAATSDPTGYVDPNRIDYVIITKAAFREAFAQLMAWKRIKGVPTKIITVEEINQKYQGADTQLRIKKCLKDLYDNHGLKYALLGGDGTVVPVRKCYFKHNAEEDSIPCDLYYACFHGTFDWDLNKNGVYGEYADNINFTQSIYVTRVPVSRVSEVNTFYNKLFSYEHNPVIQQLDNISVLMAGYDLNFYDRDAELAGEELYTKAIEPYWSGARTRFYNTCSDVEGVNITPATLQAEIAKGYDFLQMMSHGKIDSWVLGKNYDTKYASSQTNQRHTIATTIACETNAFDIPSYTCLSKSLICNPNSGIVAYLGCSRINWGSQSSPDKWPALSYEKQFYQSLFRNPSRPKHYGEVVATAKAMMSGYTSSNAAIRWIQFGLNPVGDPEMPIYTRKPLTYLSPVAKMRGDTLIVSTGAKSNVCMMSLLDNGASYYRVFDNTNMLPFIIEDLPRLCSIYVSKQNYKPRRILIYNYTDTPECSINSTTVKEDRIYKANTMYIGNTASDTECKVIFAKETTEMLAKNFIFTSGVKIEPTAKLKLTCIE